jgi:hypothetical protein
MAIFKRIVQNIKRSCYFYNGSVVLVQLCVSCRQIIAVVFLCIKYLNILNILLRRTVLLTNLDNTRNRMHNPIINTK